jgi:ribosomal protein S18 acetylase RimI-like enzyme
MKARASVIRCGSAATVADSGGERQAMPLRLRAAQPRRQTAAHMAEAVLEIRAYRESDEADVTALWTNIFPDARAWNQPRAYIERKLGVQRELFLVGVRDGRVIATVLAGYDGVRGWIYHLAVVPEMRRHGIGRAMMRAAEARLRALGCPKINLQVLSANSEVVRFYESIGYAVEDRISMGRRLEPEEA